MSDQSSQNTVKSRRPHPRHHIEIAGDVLMPRDEFALEVLGVCTKTAARMNLPTTYIGGLAFVARDASLKIVAEKVRQRNQPPARNRGR